LQMTMSVQQVSMAALIFSVALVVGGCHEKGPAEKAGETLDKAGEKISDTLDPKGPAEKAGRKIDKALHD